MARINWRTIKAPKLTAEQVAVKLYDAAKSKAAGRKLEFNLNFETVLAGVKAGRCAVSGIPFDMRQKPYGGLDFPFRASLDRIDNTIGYLDSNVQVTAKIYNQCKYVWNDEDVLHFAASIMEQHYVKNCQFRSVRVLRPQVDGTTERSP